LSFPATKIRKLLEFAAGQGAVQALGLLNGFMLLRWLSVDQYAIYTVVYAFLGMVAMLVEMQLGTCLVGLLAGRTEARTVGGYIRSVRHYRNWFLGIATPFVCVAFALMAMRQGWTIGLSASLLVLILASAFCQSWITYYSVPFMIRHDMLRLYRVSTAFAVLRLFGSYVLFIGGALGAFSVALLTTCATAAAGWIYRSQAASLVDEPKLCEPAKNQEVLGLVRPMMPAILFGAFQGQIGVMLIAWFGKEQYVAELGALGRFAQIFVMLGAFNAVILAPYIAKTPRPALLRRYICIALVALVFSACLVLSAFLLPQLYIWLIGPKYAHLAPLLWVMLAISCLNLLSGVLWCMSSARKWIFGWAAWLYIALTLTVQIICLQFMMLDTLMAVLLFSVYTSLAMLAANTVLAVAGFRSGI
jgi:O-antigen/teichoic acid export membrane protein